MSTTARFLWLNSLWLCLLLLPTTAAHAQNEVTAGADSSVVATPRTPTVEDSLRRSERLFGRRVTRPAKAAYLSLMFPGLGQIYNKQYWKLPLVYGAVGGTIFGEIRYQTLYRQFVNGYDSITDGNPKTLDRGTQSKQYTTADGKKQGIVFYRRQRDVFLAYVVLAYGLNIVDALVAAHLHDFDVSDDLSLHFSPTMLYMPTALVTPGLSLSLHFSPTRPSRSPR